MSRVADGYFRKVLTDFDITENQMTILFALSKLGKVPQGIVGQKLVLERSSVSRAVRLLEKQQLIKRTAEYRPEIELTKKGKDMVNTLLPLWEKAMDKLTSKLGHDGIDHLTKLEKKFI